ncbi:MAG: LVIVD repeat-containing protein [Acidimicrobiales bacterium]
MTTRRAGHRRQVGAVALLAVVALLVTSPLARAEGDPATPKAMCGPGALPETDIQGRVPTADYESGRTKQGYLCNTEQISHEGASGGFRVYRYIDASGHECGYYDTTLLIGVSLLLGPNAGVAVLDMSDPSHPVRTATLITPAMLSPHESLNLNQRRGLLAAVMGSPGTAPGIVDIYDLSVDCRFPQLRSTGVAALAGHEATFSPDGNTFYVTATALPYLTALDVTDPTTPTPVWTSTDHLVHGMNVSDDGNRLYTADLGASRGLTILDVTQVQQRVPNPQVPVISHLTWSNVSVPQTNLPITIAGRPYVVEIDEYAGAASADPAAPVGAGRIIDIADEANPAVVSNLRLEVNDPISRAGPQKSDPGADSPAQGYAGHYCAVPQRDDPGIVACSFIVSGLRIFDIRDPARPSEIAYFNPPSRDFGASPAAAAPATATESSAGLSGLYSCRLAVANATAPAADPPIGTGDLLGNIPGLPASGSTLSHYAMSAPTFVPERKEVWYSDGLYGFYALRLTNGVWEPVASAPAEQAELAAPAPVGETLPATGRATPLFFVLAALVVAAAATRAARSTRP